MSLKLDFLVEIEESWNLLQLIECNCFANSLSQTKYEMQLNSGLTKNVTVVLTSETRTPTDVRRRG